MSFILYIKHRFFFASFCLSAFTLDQMYFVFVKLKETKQQNMDVLIIKRVTNIEQCKMNFNI